MSELRKTVNILMVCVAILAVLIVIVVLVGKHNRGESYDERGNSGYSYPSLNDYYKYSLGPIENNGEFERDLSGYYECLERAFTYPENERDTYVKLCQYDHKLYNSWL